MENEITSEKLKEWIKLYVGEIGLKKIITDPKSEYYVKLTMMIIKQIGEDKGWKFYSEEKSRQSAWLLRCFVTTLNEAIHE